MRYNVILRRNVSAHSLRQCRYTSAKSYWKMVTIKAGSWSLTLGTTISTNFPGKFTLESFGWCMFGLNVTRCKPHLIRCCGHDLRKRKELRRDGAACRPRINPDWSYATYQRHRYPSTVSVLLSSGTPPSRDILTWVFLHIFRFRGSLASSDSLDRIRRVSTVSRNMFRTRLPPTRNSRYIFREIFLRKVFYCCRGRME